MSWTNIWICNRCEELNMTVQFGVPLSEFAKGKSQVEVAELLGVTQGAISQMMLSGRDVRVLSGADGRPEGFEIRRIGSRRKKAAA